MKETNNQAPEFSSNSETPETDLQSIGKKANLAIQNTEQGEVDDRILTIEEIRAFVKEYEARRIAEAPKEVEFYATQLQATERAFGDQLDRSKARGEKHIGKKEYEIWERDFHENWTRLQNQVHLGNLDANAEATAEAPMFLSYNDQSVLSRTIEAQAAHFFSERYMELVNAIRSSGDAKAKEDEAIVRGLYGVASEHIAWRTMTVDEIKNYGMKEADRARINSHNEVIRHLNAINDLAEKYNTTRFTARNFWPSNPDKKQPPAIEHRLRNDRDIVEEYYQIAFEPEYRQAMKRLEDDRRYW